MGRDEIAARVARYAEVVNAPVALATELRRLTPLDRGGFRATTSRGDLTARQVVVATGSYHTPRIPPAAARISDRVDAAAFARLPQRGRAARRRGARRRLRADRRSSWPRSSSRRAGPCTSPSDPRAASLAATEGATSSAGSSTSCGTAPRTA